MKSFAVFLYLWLLSIMVMAQPPVQTLVPRETIAVGQAFQVQYVVNELQYFEGLQTPQFGPDFKQVSGPTMYNGTVVKEGKTIPVHNYSFTLVALRKGRLPVSGATAIYSHKKETSQPSFITCAETGVNTQDPNAIEPIEQKPKSTEPSLLVKATVNKRECYVGEPIVATFTLLSKVVTAAEVVKNPGFYGFSVLEMSRGGVQLVEADATDGYEIHQLRKVQLYPMQAGELVIDDMTVHNYAQFTDTVTGETKAKEVTILSPHITIRVKPLPPNKGEAFTGAVGHFTLQAQLKEARLTAGQTGKLQVTLQGAGNFIQLPMLEVPWPANIEGFEPTVEEDLQKEVIPERGKKVYEFSFTTDSAGDYVIPPISLTFFNPDSEQYQTTTTDSLRFTVAPQKGLKIFINQVKDPENNDSLLWIAIGAGIMLLAGLLFWFTKKNRAKVPVKVAEPEVLRKTLTYTAQLKNLQPHDKDIKGFYAQLQQLVLQFLKSEYGIGTAGKGSVHQQIEAAAFTAIQKKDLQSIIEECESVQYYNATPSVSFNALQNKAIATVSSLEKGY